MPDYRNFKKLLFDEIQSAPKKRFEDSIKASLKTFSIDHDSWEAEAQDRCEWRAAVYEGAKRSWDQKDTCSRAAQAGKKR